MAFKNIADQTNGFYIPCVSLFGPGCAKEIGIKAQNLGAKKALIVTDEGLFKFGVAATISEYLKNAGVDSHIFAGAEPNPTDINVHNGVQAYNDNDCDFIVSLGGGSSHDCAKGIGLVTAGGGHIRDYEGIDKSTVPMTPLIAINTTAGTASEMTRFCIITNTDTHVKMAIVDWRCTPLIAIDDPKLMVAKPAGLTAATGMDALTHAVEAYVSTAANPITDACAEKAISMISQWLRPAVANGENIEARDAMSYAQYLAGMAFNNASLGYVHAMAHQLGGFYNLPHGVCNAVLLPHVCEFNLIACQDRYAKIAELMGVNTNGFTETEAAYAAIDAIRELSASIGIPSGLTELGVKTEDLAIMAENAQKDACMLTNPRKATHAQVVEIFKAAL
ncbi:iron-containing alcohol dehydrogenase [Acinetobacter haemolyticus]|uniref:iron-dependent methanol dehydrogenase n=1 Tax=Acinetobacter haemolyticus TaxID=29430 RepID=UPI000E585B9F|nr:iron-containing alcohol dehydrogenase [Acinetobacter haemolyticus]NAR49415.1 iron-containing alcohol dehydrogenase [Acinetobacter haemolyticus]NAR56442.1 iron-containing alcohol dehydrogenase [Acinetobacter haemolyticus]NAR79273.1 iron-containing alcohol dehydrogenase [Acinetobacter haemolyticus]NAR89108.1 iron-containing alcohol dehydrogenase [Acinetobacter haemolyticus]NAR95394.1 iron-containing alcohol dehydrogenase [Acinetobacter haemolyticus]